jgi:REP element-mobilizing transposase RayT
MSRNYRHYADGDYIYFITTTVVEWIPLFILYRYCNILIDSLNYCRQHKGLLLHAYVIMPNHIHLIASSKPTTALPDIVRDLKRHTSRLITHCLEEENALFQLQLLRQLSHTGRGNTEYKVWQDGYHPIAIYTQKFFRQKLDYLHDNPVRKGFVRRPEEWQYSSAYDYVCERQGVIEIDRLEV